MTSNPNKQLFFLPGEVFAWDSDFKMPRIQVMTFGIQRELFRNLSIDTGYVGKISHHLEDTVNLNQAVYIPGVNAAGNALSTLGNIDARRNLVPNTYQKINMMESVGNAAYHSFQFSAKYRSGQFTGLAAYTFSKSIDTGQNTNVQGVPHQNNFNLRADRGLSEFNRTHVFRLSAVYAVPNIHAQPVVNWIANGWELSGITSITTGAPFTIRTGRDNSLSGVGNDRANLVGDPSLPDGRSRGEQVLKFFNTAAFVANPIGQFGNVGRNTMIGPRYSNTDLAALRNFSIKERLKLQFRAEFFNAFNQVNFNTPVNTVTSGTFGRLTSAQSPRLVQFGLKLGW